MYIRIRFWQVHMKRLIGRLRLGSIFSRKYLLFNSLILILIVIISHWVQSSHTRAVPMVMNPWMTGMCKQSALNGAFRRCQPAQWSPLLNAREKGHSSPNCSTKPELPGLYLAWLSSMTQTCEALMGVKNQSTEKSKGATTCTRQK